MSAFMNFAFLSGKPPKPNGRSVAVIGAGPSGLAAAGYLASIGYKVDLYDKLPKAGGLMVFGIPGHRIPEERILDGVAHLEAQYGVTFHPCTKICGSEPLNGEAGDHFSANLVSLGELGREHDAVIICTGSWKSRKMGVPGEHLPGVLSGLEYLFPIRAARYAADHIAPIDVAGRRVVVVGAGHSAVDVAHSAVAHGAKAVTMLYRRTRAEAPCGSYEVTQLQERGVRWMELATPVRVLGTDKVEGLEYVQCTLGAPDRSGRCSFVPEEGSNRVLPADTVVTAIGEIATPPFADDLGLANVRKGEIHWLQMTRIPGVFVAGDALTGPSKIGKAVYSGLRAAKSLAQWLDLKALGRLEEYKEDAVITREDWVEDRI
ncbi:MAG: FAD-dependent oxidoreductase [Desulfovibrionaceae bacterium]